MPIGDKKSLSDLRGPGGVYNTINLNLYAFVGVNPLKYVDITGLDLTPAQQVAIVEAASDWSNSNVPYVTGGTTKEGADCSGAMYGIYNQAGIGIERITSSTLSESPNFTKVDGDPQVGDIGLYPGHVVLYGGEKPRKDRNVWSASHPGGRPFGPAKSTWYDNGKPTWYRYIGDSKQNQNSTQKNTTTSKKSNEPSGGYVFIDGNRVKVNAAEMEAIRWANQHPSEESQ